MAFPVSPFVRSSLLKNQTNGKLSPKILTSTPGQAGGATVVLVKPAARAWRALVAAAKRDGHILKATSVADSYRVYEIQERIFRQRYTTTRLPGRPYKVWQGKRWYQKPGTAVAAVPGTSNHGWASAVDTGEERDSDAGAESLDSRTLAWLIAHERTYGWSHELQSEPWHIRYVAGDRIPAAVLAYERSLSQPPTDPATEETAVANYIVKKSGSTQMWVTDGISKRLVNDATEALVLHGAGVGQLDANEDPFIWPASVVDDLHTLSRG